MKGYISYCVTHNKVISHIFLYESGTYMNWLKIGRSFAVKDEIFCLFEGALDNLGSLRQQYGLAKSANEVILVIEAYKALRDRAPYPPNHVVGHLSGSFAFIVYDKSTSTLFVASVSHTPLYTDLASSLVKLTSLVSLVLVSNNNFWLVGFGQDQFGKVPLYWGITADGYVAFADNAELLKGACGKSLASFPQGWLKIVLVLIIYLHPQTIGCLWYNDENRIKGRI